MAQVQGNNLLDVLKKKMRQTKEEMEKYKEESEDMARKLQVEIRRREEVSLRHHYLAHHHQCHQEQFAKISGCAEIR